MRHDLRFAWRQLRRNLGFTLTSVLVLGLGIGVGTAMYSVLNTVLLRPLPYAQPGRLVTLEHPRNPGNIQGEASAPDVQDWQQRSRTLAQIAYTQGGMAWLRLPAETHFIEDDAASANLFATLGVAPRIGRTFTAQDQAAQAKVVVLSNLIWKQYFQARPDIIGQEIRLGDSGYTVIGIMPSGFSYPYGAASLWTPYLPAPGGERGDAMLTVIGRLAPGATPQSAQAEMSGIQAEIARQYSSQHLASRVLVRGYHDEMVAGVRPALFAMTAAVALIWLIACFSVASLLLTRFASRRQELAVRSALGASSSRLAGQLLSESLLLGALASAVGVAISVLALAALRHFLVSRLPLGDSIAMSGTALLGLLGVTLASILLIGLAPALLAARAPAQAGLRGGGKASAAPAQSYLRDGLVIGEIALALVLLASAGLLLRTLYSLRQVPLGFTTENVVTASLFIPQGRFASQNMNQVFDQPLLTRLEALPGVQAAALTSVIPLERGFTMSGRFRYVGRANVPPEQQPQGDVRFTSPGYPKVLGIPLERGRFFDPSLDTASSPRVIVVNHTFAAKYFPGDNPVGQQISMGPELTATIVGVLADVRENAIDAPPHPVMHFSTTQIAPGGDLYPMASAFTALAVRSRVPAATLIPRLRSTLHDLAPDLAVNKFDTMSGIVSDAMGSQILAARLLGLFALAALVIALTGLYGLLAYGVTQRTREMGIRIALGAERGQIVGLVLRRAVWLLGFGVAAGLALALGFGHLLAAYLYGVAANDPWTLAAVAGLLLIAGLWAAWLPARRAARVNPLSALRAE